VNIVSSHTHQVRGQATDDSGVAIVQVNGIEAALDGSGNFSAGILLKPGQNEITVSATDTRNNSGKKTFSVTREAAQLPTKQAAVQSASISAGEYHALIIGVEEYIQENITDLSEPIKDARKIKAILESQYTFSPDNIRLLSNPTRGQILDEFDRLTEKLTASDNLLIFYAGHGYWDEQREEGYWLPADARQNLRRDWIPNSSIVSAINGIKTQHTLLVSDACFSGGIFKTRKAFNDASPATKVLYALPSRKAMTSGTLTEVPDQSVFVDYLTRRLENNPDKYLSSRSLFSSFRTAVINNSPLNQVPQYGEIRQAGDEGGDFIFVRR
jgi:hypothetical protein